jgi:hypothetical protein
MDSLELALENEREQQQRDYNRYEAIRNLRYVFQMIDEMKIQLIDKVGEYTHKNYGGTVDYDCPSLCHGLINKSIKLMKMWEILTDCKLIDKSSNISKTNSDMKKRQKIFNKLNKHYKENWMEWGSIKNHKSLYGFQEDIIQFENDNERKT